MNPQTQPAKTQSRLRKRLLQTLAGLTVLYLVLLVPEPRIPPPPGAGKSPFAWNRDAFWSGLERQFVEARSVGCEALSERVSNRFAEANGLLTGLQGTNLPPEAKEFDRLETDIFELAPLVAACPQRFVEFTALAERTRAAIKRQSEHWDLHSTGASERLYRMLFGTRMALEEVMLQSGDPKPAELTRADDEPSQTPGVEVRGLTLHSGDILISRGGAPTSALIARGSDHPGSFSHVALLHVDEKSGQAMVIESHIECGVAVGSFDDYLRDKKLRIMVLRLRADLPVMKADPMLPHAAATAALRESKQRHIPYDFAMDYHDPQKQFCSEVVSAAYSARNVRLWLGPSYISDPVTCAWLASMGVTHFETQEPSDLEYDPQLRVVAEWRDRTTLLKAHADDAVTDTMLAAGPPGEPLPFQFYLLPFARLAKVYSAALNRAGRVGPIPEGLSATQGLRVSKYQSDHDIITQRLLVLADQFKQEKGYQPPYWELVRLAHDARTGQGGSNAGR